MPDPVEILQTLIRFDTTNPPGNEAEAIGYLNNLLQSQGIATTILAKDAQRPNLIARLPGRGDAPPLLMYGHVDVVGTADQTWTHPPFAGDIVDGFLWGRGTLDMKGGVAMMVAAFLQAQAAPEKLPGDLILAIVCDEEVDGDYGARFLVEEHADLFAGVRYAIGEGGGFSVQLAGQKFYPIMVGEKQVCSVQAVLRGRGGHGSMPLRNGAMARLGQLVTTLTQKRLPVHISPVTRQMIGVIAGALPRWQGLAMRQLLNPALTDRILNVMGEQGTMIDPLLHNTVSPTIVRGGHKINVIPGEIRLDLDGRLLPGFSPDDMLHELRQLAGNDVEWRVTRFDPGPGDPDMALFDMLAGVLRQADPASEPFPLLLSGVTDGRYFARLGIQTYGFLPMDLPDGLISTIHAADERVPVTAVASGAQTLFQALRRFGAAF
ncbi:MAG: M20/M25/M40 family metallo-hydrolase [Anaerolineae bacterium]